MMSHLQVENPIESGLISKSKLGLDPIKKPLPLDVSVAAKPMGKPVRKIKVSIL